MTYFTQWNLSSKKDSRMSRAPAVKGMSFSELPLNLQRRISWLHRQNLWKQRKVPQCVQDHRKRGDTLFEEKVFFTINDRKSLQLSRRFLHCTNINTSHVSTQLTISSDTGVALVYECYEATRSVVVSLKTCYVKQMHVYEETRDSDTSEVRNSDRKITFDGIVLTCSTQSSSGARKLHAHID